MVRSQWAAAFLVAVDLVWVMGTGALDRFTATILAVLVAAAPFSARFPRGRTWNGFWNAALALAFLLLLQRVIGSGTDGLLGGGVLLAMACQIHLLHVGSGEKRGDLLTFNSVLIALVAGQAGRIEGFTPFAALWGAALVTFLIAEADPRGRRARHAFRRTLAPAAVLAAGTLGLATLVPSDLRIHDPVEPGALGFVGQTDIQPEARIDLRQFRPPADEDAVLFRIAPRTGSPADVPAHWREAVLEHQDGSRFLHVHRIERDAPLGVESFPDGRGPKPRPTRPAAAPGTARDRGCFHSARRLPRDAARHGGRRVATSSPRCRAPRVPRLRARHRALGSARRDRVTRRPGSLSPRRRREPRCRASGDP